MEWITTGRLPTNEELLPLTCGNPGLSNLFLTLDKDGYRLERFFRPMKSDKTYFSGYWCDRGNNDEVLYWSKLPPKPFIREI